MVVVVVVAVAIARFGLFRFRTEGGVQVEFDVSGGGVGVAGVRVGGRRDGYRLLVSMSESTHVGEDEEVGAR